MCHSFNKLIHWCLFYARNAKELYEMGCEYEATGDEDDAFNSLIYSSRLGYVQASIKVAQMYKKKSYDMHDWFFWQHQNYLLIAGNQGSEASMKEYRENEAKMKLPCYQRINLMPKPDPPRPIVHSRPAPKPKTTTSSTTSYKPYVKTQQPCYDCFVKGWIKCNRCNYNGYIRDYGGNRKTCYDCNGHGTVRCKTCNGSKTILR